MTKRIFDIIIGSILIISCFPFLLFLTIILMFSTKGHPFFMQLRVGRHNKTFPFYKFRTMKSSDSNEWKPEKDVQRITYLGNYLRKFSLDELPQLWNVIKGDMSLVGPRPLPVEYLPLYSKEQLKRHSVRPGLTGWAQINGRNSISWNERFNLDLWYVENASFKLDIVILFKTVIHFFETHNVNKSNDLTMDKFTGTKN